jgi:hypothetical protein
MKKSKTKTKQRAALKRGAKRKNREKASLKGKHARREEFLSKKNEEIRKQEDEIRKILESRPTY